MPIGSGSELSGARSSRQASLMSPMLARADGHMSCQPGLLCLRSWCPWRACSPVRSKMLPPVDDHTPAGRDYSAGR
jgi:hypothetical protein